MMDRSRMRVGFFAALSAGGLAACSGGGDSGPGTGTGTLALSLTDGPVENATKLVVELAGIELKPTGGPAMEPVPMNEDNCGADNWNATTQTCSIDLLEYTGAESKPVFSESLPAGIYQWVRLLVTAQRNTMDSCVALDDGTACSLWVPSSEETGLKVVSGIIVTANGRSSYTLDLDARKSVTNPPGLAAPDGLGEGVACLDDYILKPAIRIVDDTEVGSVAGTVADSILAGGSCGIDDLQFYDNVAVYVYEDPDATIDADDYDIDELDGGNPITSAAVEWDANADGYTYEVGFLLPGDYRLALSCTANMDEAEDNDFDPADPEGMDFRFIAERNVEVLVDSEADGSFPAPVP